MKACIGVDTWATMQERALAIARRGDAGQDVPESDYYLNLVAGGRHRPIQRSFQVNRAAEFACDRRLRTLQSASTRITTQSRSARWWSISGAVSFQAWVLRLSLKPWSLAAPLTLRSASLRAASRASRVVRW